ncbi:hypothetical protein YC2023_048482 [Brassica napus]
MELKTQANQASILRRQPLSELGLKRCIFQQKLSASLKNVLIFTHPNKVKKSLLLDVPTPNAMVKKPPRANWLESIRLKSDVTSVSLVNTNSMGHIRSHLGGSIRSIN